MHKVLSAGLLKFSAGKKVFKDFLKTFLMIAFPFGYSCFVIMLAVYLQVTFALAGIVMVCAAVVPVIAVWAKIMFKREAESMKARVEGFQTSPERRSQVLGEYVQLIQDRGEELTVPRDKWTSITVGSNTWYFRFSDQINLSDGQQQYPNLPATEGAKYDWRGMEITVSKVHADDVLLLIKNKNTVPL